MVWRTESAAEAYARYNDTWILTTAKGWEGTLFSAIDHTPGLSDVYANDSICAN